MPSRITDSNFTGKIWKEPRARNINQSNTWGSVDTFEKVLKRQCQLQTNQTGFGHVMGVSAQNFFSLTLSLKLPIGIEREVASTSKGCVGASLEISNIFYDYGLQSVA